jgi:hypothetical protein
MDDDIAMRLTAYRSKVPDELFKKLTLTKTGPLTLTGGELAQLLPMAIALNKDMNTAIFNELVNKYGKSNNPLVDYSKNLIIKFFDGNNQCKSLIHSLLESLIGPMLKQEIANILKRALEEELGEKNEE